MHLLNIKRQNELNVLSLSLYIKNANHHWCSDEDDVKGMFLIFMLT